MLCSTPLIKERVRTGMKLLLRANRERNEKKEGMIPLLRQTLIITKRKIHVKESIRIHAVMRKDYRDLRIVVFPLPFHCRYDKIDDNEQWTMNNEQIRCPLSIVNCPLTPCPDAERLPRNP